MEWFRYGMRWEGRARPKAERRRPKADVVNVRPALRGSVLVRGFDSRPFPHVWGPGGSVRGHFDIFREPTIIFIFSLLYPYSAGVAVLYISV